MENAIIDEYRLESREEILRDAVDKVYEEAAENNFEFMVDVIGDAHREFSRLFNAGSPADQREEVLRGTLDAIYHEAVAEECEVISNIIRRAYRSLSNLSDDHQVA